MGSKSGDPGVESTGKAEQGKAQSDGKPDQAGKAETSAASQPASQERKPRRERGELGGILTTTKDRVAEILVATDKAATEIVDAANKEAERVVRETHERATQIADSRMARISALTEHVLAKTGTLEGEIDELRRLVGESVRALGDELGVDSPGGLPESEAPAEDAKSAPRRTGRFTRPEEVPLEIDGQTPKDRAEAVKLLAIQMIATGHTAEHASRRLRSEFHVEDPAAVLDSIGAPVS